MTAIQLPTPHIHLRASPFPHFPPSSRPSASLVPNRSPSPGIWGCAVSTPLLCACMLRALCLVFFVIATINASKAGVLRRVQVGGGNGTKLGGHISSHGPQAPLGHTTGTRKGGAKGGGQSEKEEG